MPICFPLPLRLVRVAARDDMVEDAEEGEEGTGGVGGRGAELSQNDDLLYLKMLQVGSVLLM